jgi:hypothetical protein
LNPRCLDGQRIRSCCWCAQRFGRVFHKAARSAIPEERKQYTAFGRAQSEWQKLGTTDCTSLRQRAVDGRHVIEALEIICGRMALTLKAGECTHRESFVVF